MILYSLIFSKYMALFLNWNRFTKMIFCCRNPPHSNIKDLEFCANSAQQSECGQQNYWSEHVRPIRKRSLLSKNTFPIHGQRFEIDMTSVFKKILTYRASLTHKNEVSYYSQTAPRPKFY